MSASRSNDQRAEKRAARDLAKADGLPYQEALRQVRAQNAVYAVTVLLDTDEATTLKVTGLQAARDAVVEHILMTPATSGNVTEPQDARRILAEVSAFVGQARNLPVDGGKIGPTPSDVTYRVTLAKHLVGLEQGLRGECRDGYTDAMIHDTLSTVSRALDLDVVCVWDYRDEYGFGGDSEIVVHTGNQFVQTPDGLLGFLDGNGDGIIDPRTVGTAAHAFIALADLQVRDVRNLAREDRYIGEIVDDENDDPTAGKCKRCEGTGIDPAAPGNRCELCGGTGHEIVTENLVARVLDAIESVPAERMGDLWSRYTNLMLDIRDVGRIKYSDPDDWRTLLTEMTAADA